MKRNCRFFILLFSFIFALVSGIFTTGCSGRDEFKSTIAKGMINSSEISMTMTIQELELKFGQPKEKRNIETWGFYSYDIFFVFFNNPLTYYDGNKIVSTDPAENSIAFIRWFQNISIFGAIIDLTTMDTILKKYGDPDMQYFLKPEDDDATFSTGMKIVYISGKYALSYNYNPDTKIITYADLLPASMLPD